MADQWEMCASTVYRINIYTPVRFEELSHKDFIKRYEEKYKQAIGNYSEITSIRMLLFDGWEPYAAENLKTYFRRKYQG